MQPNLFWIPTCISPPSPYAGLFFIFTTMEKYTNGLDMGQFKIINAISSYNFNYHVGFGNDLLFAQSDDDNTTEWWLIWREKSFFIGYSFCSEGDILHLDNSNL